MAKQSLSGIAAKAFPPRISGRAWYLRLRSARPGRIVSLAGPLREELLRTCGGSGCQPLSSAPLNEKCRMINPACRKNKSELLGRLQTVELLMFLC